MYVTKAKTYPLVGAHIRFSSYICSHNFRFYIKFRALSILKAVPMHYMGMGGGGGGGGG